MPRQNPAEGWKRDEKTRRIPREELSPGARPGRPLRKRRTLAGVRDRPVSDGEPPDRNGTIARVPIRAGRGPSQGNGTRVTSRGRERHPGDRTLSARARMAGASPVPPGPHPGGVPKGRPRGHPTARRTSRGLPRLRQPKPGRRGRRAENVRPGGRLFLVPRSGRGRGQQPTGSTRGASEATGDRNPERARTGARG